MTSDFLLAQRHKECLLFQEDSPYKWPQFPTGKQPEIGQNKVQPQPAINRVRVFLNRVISPHLHIYIEAIYKGLTTPFLTVKAHRARRA